MTTVGKELKNRNVNWKKYAFVYGMIAFPIVQFAIFYIWVNFNSIIIAFQEFDGYMETGGEKYIWSLQNFKNFFLEWKLPNSEVIIGLKNTLKYFIVNLVFLLPACFLISYFLYKKIAGYKAFRVIFFLPSIISAVVLVTVYKNIIQKYGPVYTILDELFNYQLPSLLSDNETATPTIIFYTIWTGFGINMLLYQGAMGRVPEEVIEAGILDGIPWWRELFSVIMPMVWPTLSTTIILQITGLFNSTGPILLFSSAGVVAGSYETTTLSYWIYAQTYSGTNYNYPAAIGIFFTLVSFPIVLITRWTFAKIDPDVEY